MPGRWGLSELQLGTRCLCFQEQTLSLLCEEQHSVLSDYSLDHRWPLPISRGCLGVHQPPTVEAKARGHSMDPGDSVKAGSHQPGALPPWSPGVFPHFTKHKPLVLWATCSWYLHRWQKVNLCKGTTVSWSSRAYVVQGGTFKFLQSNSRKTFKRARRKLSWASTARSWSTCMVSKSLVTPSLYS